MHHPGHIRFSLLLGACLLALAIGVCGGGPVVVDGYRLGEPASCQILCEDFGNEAIRWLDRVSPGRASIDRIELRASDIRNANGDRMLLIRSGSRGDYIVVIHLADGSTRAVYVGCGIGIDPDRCFSADPNEIFG